MTVSRFTVALMAFDRFLITIQSLAKYRTPQKSQMECILLWAIALLCNSYVFVYRSVGDDNKCKWRLDEDFSKYIKTKYFRDYY